MRPLRLSVQGFTAFRDRQDLDLRENDLFAICGPTGSGKSSLLDALTYALYGRVERVGDECKDLISQGLSRMAVTLDFRVGPDDYRITRATRRDGSPPTQVRLRRLRDGVEEDYGPGADRVREVGQIVANLVGLDYVAFTRTVLLPQGKFAEFLSGDPQKRREILSDLLELSLFKELSARAGDIARAAESDAATKQVLVETEYQGVSAEALAAEEERARTAKEHEAALSTAASTVAALTDRADEADRAARDLTACAREIAGSAEAVAGAVAAVGTLADEAGRADQVLRVAAAAATAGARAARDARDARATAERKWGAEADVSALRERARSLDPLRREAAAAGRAHQTAAAALPQYRDAVAATAGAVARIRAALAKAQRAQGAARAALREAEHADSVAALTRGLAKGDPCPVCGEPLARAPRQAAGALKRARAAVAEREQERETLEERARGRERVRDEARRDAEHAAKEAARLKQDARHKADAVAREERALARALPEVKLERTVATLEERIAELRALTRAERATAIGELDVERRRAAAQRERDGLDAKIAAQRSVVGLDVAPILRRARDAGATDVPIPRPGPLPATEAGPRSLADYGERTAAALARLAQDLDGLAAERARSAKALAGQAFAVGGGLVRPGADLRALREAVAGTLAAAAGAAATAEADAKRMAKQLASLARLKEDVVKHREREQVFRSLANELRADNIVAFLQAEAMHELAAAASRHLERLSSGRYRMRTRKDEFTVLDVWNGEEERGVRTLSGGETFLASLSLALALSEQVRVLSVVERARLDSLFLDEGFGTLDTEALDVVCDAIEQLGGDGRLVGVVTHVRELAERFPRVEIERSPRGSTLRFVEA